MAFGYPRKDSLDMRHRLPGRLVGLAASLRSMPTAYTEVYQASSTTVNASKKIKFQQVGKDVFQDIGILTNLRV